MQVQPIEKWTLTVQYDDNHRETALYDSKEQALTYGLAVTEDYQDATFRIAYVPF